MKKHLLYLLLLLLAGRGQAQTFKEWFRQKKTQKEYLMVQIAALKAYKDQLQKGYNTVKKGTDLISDITSGELSLHTDYFSSLKAVNPEIRQQSRADDIAAWRKYMLEDKKRIEKLLSENHKLFTDREIKGYMDWYSEIGKEADHDMDDLKLLLEDGRLELTDEQRLQRIGALYGSMQKKYSRQKRMSHALGQAMRFKEKSQRETEILRKMHGLP